MHFKISYFEEKNFPRKIRKRLVHDFNQKIRDLKDLSLVFNLNNFFIIGVQLDFVFAFMRKLGSLFQQDIGQVLSSMSINTLNIKKYIYIDLKKTASKSDQITIVFYLINQQRITVL